MTRVGPPAILRRRLSVCVCVCLCVRQVGHAHQLLCDAPDRCLRKPPRLGFLDIQARQPRPGEDARGPDMVLPLRRRKQMDQHDSKRPARTPQRTEPFLCCLSVLSSRIVFCGSCSTRPTPATSSCRTCPGADGTAAAPPFAVKWADSPEAKCAVPSALVTELQTPALPDDDDDTSMAGPILVKHSCRT